MILDINKAREIGEALIDASENAEQLREDQAVILLDGCGLAVPLHSDLQDLYNSVAIIKV
jgi:hypothetical protein|tara:strand:+ start:399 stop:578 length:180 start_codon:yes stop_codon:yes gene_type:complete